MCAMQIVLPQGESISSVRFMLVDLAFPSTQDSASLLPDVQVEIRLLREVCCGKVLSMAFVTTCVQLARLLFRITYPMLQPPSMLSSWRSSLTTSGVSSLKPLTRVNIFATNIVCECNAYSTKRDELHPSSLAAVCHGGAKVACSLFSHGQHQAAGTL